MEDTLPSGHPDREHGSPRPLRSLIIVLAVIAVLTVGWPLVSRAVSDSQPVAAGQPLTIGPGGSDAATFTPGPDWAVHNAETNTVEDWSLSDGPVNLTVAYVTLLGPSQAGRLWPGLQRTLLLGDASARLGRPATTTTTAAGGGGTGLTGTVTANNLAGQADVFVGPDADFAIEIVSAAPVDDHAAAQAATALVARSLRFPAAVQ
jgi:hypothetical protein